MATACDGPTSPGGAAAFDPGQRPDVDLAAPLMAYAKQLAAIPVVEALAGSLTIQAGAVRQSKEASPTILVDDDGKQCPGARTTIQAAVEFASPGATILVCSGTYHGSVKIWGPSKNGIQLIAKGDDDEIDDEEIDDEDDARNEGKVVLAGDHTEQNGFWLQDVSGVRIQGFTVRDFGDMPSSSTVVGMGNNILLLRAHGNTISRNVLTGSDMMGIWLINSGSNLVEHNLARDNDAKTYGLGCGIMLSAPDAAGKALSANNVFRHNVSRGNPLAGIMIGNAGTGTVVSQNVLSRGGRFGLRFWDTENALIERNVMSNNRGLFTNPAAPQFARGLDLRRSGGSTVRRNIAFRNGPAAGSFDFFWDGLGGVSFDHNRCGTSQPAGLCKRGDD